MECEERLSDTLDWYLGSNKLRSSLFLLCFGKEKEPTAGSPAFPLLHAACPDYRLRF